MDEGGELDETATKLKPLDQLQQDGDGQVRLAAARRPHEQQARLAKADPLLEELVDVALSGLARRHELRVLPGFTARDVEVRQPAVAIAGGNPRRLDQTGQHVALLAGALAGRARPAIGDDNPPPATAFRAGLFEDFTGQHAEIVTRGRSHPGPLIT